MGLFDFFKKKSSTTQRKKKQNSNVTTVQSKTYICARCKKEITDQESQWVDSHHLCVNCAAPSQNAGKEKHLEDEATEAVHQTHMGYQRDSLKNKENCIINAENNKDKKVVNSIDSSPNKVESLVDFQAADVELKHNADYLVQRASMRMPNDRKTYLLYVCQPTKGEICGIFAIIKNEQIAIYPEVLKNDILYSCYSADFGIGEFFSLTKEELLSKLRIFQRTFTCTVDLEMVMGIRSGMMKLFPDYNYEHFVRKPIFEKYFPITLDNIVGAENIMNSGRLYIVLPPTDYSRKKAGIVDFQVWNVYNWKQENETRHLLESYSQKWSDLTEEAFLSHFLRLHNAAVEKILSFVPHRVIHLDSQDSQNCGAMYFSGNYRELHIFHSKTEKSIMMLKVYSVYNGHPREGGRMEGYTVCKTIEIPSEQYTWTDEELIAKYSQYFNERRHDEKEHSAPELAEHEDVRPFAEAEKQIQCDPASVAFQRIQTADGALATSYKILVGGYEESALSASAVKYKSNATVTYTFRCEQFLDRLYEKSIKWIARNYDIPIVSVPLYEDYWDALDPDEEASEYRANFQIDNCKLELWEKGDQGTVGLKVRNDTKNFADTFVARLLNGVMTEF